MYIISIGFVCEGVYNCYLNFNGFDKFKFFIIFHGINIMQESLKMFQLGITK